MYSTVPYGTVRYCTVQMYMYICTAFSRYVVHVHVNVRVLMWSIHLNLEIMARPFLAELAVITDTVVATQQTDDSRSCRISAEAVAAGGFNSSGTPSLMNRQAEQTANKSDFFSNCSYLCLYPCDYKGVQVLVHVLSTCTCTLKYSCTCTIKY